MSRKHFKMYFFKDLKDLCAATVNTKVKQFHVKDVTWAPSTGGQINYAKGKKNSKVIELLVFTSSYIKTFIYSYTWLKTLNHILQRLNVILYTVIIKLVKILIIITKEQRKFIIWHKLFLRWPIPSNHFFKYSTREKGNAVAVH